MGIENYINERYEGNPIWFEEEVEQPEHTNRIAKVLDNRDYLNGKHKVLEREDTEYQGKIYEVNRTIYNTCKSLINFHSSFILGKPISLGGSNDMTQEYRKVIRQGGYDKINYDIVDRILKYGQAIEYIYYDNKKEKITSKLINAEDYYPVYSEHDGSYLAGIECYTVKSNGVTYTNIYYEDYVEQWSNVGGTTTLKDVNKSFGLPIVYSDNQNMNGDGMSIINDIEPLISEFESFLNKLSDSLYVNTINPLLVSTGSAPVVPEGVDASGSGYMLNINDGSLEYVSSQMDSQSIKLYLDNLKQQIYDVAQVPSVVFSGNVANVSENSIKLLFIASENRANAMAYVLDDGMDARHEIMREILSMQGTVFEEDSYVEPIFNFNTPMSNESEIASLSLQYNDGVIDRQAYLELSPNIVDSDGLLSRMERTGVESETALDVE